MCQRVTADENGRFFKFWSINDITMVPAKGKYGHVSKGKGATNVRGGAGAAAVKLKEIKTEKVSDAEESGSEEASSSTDLQPLDHVKHMPRFTSSKYRFLVFSSLVVLLLLSNDTVNFTPNSLRTDWRERCPDGRPGCPPNGARDALDFGCFEVSQPAARNGGHNGQTVEIIVERAVVAWKTFETGRTLSEESEGSRQILWCPNTSSVETSQDENCGK